MFVGWLSIVRNTSDLIWSPLTRSEYVKCQKGKVSTTTLIASGIGVTVAILALVGLGVWLCNRQRRGRQGSKRLEDGSSPTPTRGKTPSPSSHRPRVNSDDDSEPEQLDEKRPVKRMIDTTQSANAKRDPRAARVESGSSSSESVAETPPPPHPAHVVPKPALPSEIINSPVEVETTRTLYPSNPSPNPRHLRSTPQASAQAQNGVRFSAYSRRQSTLSVVGAGGIGAPPPMPVRSNTGTSPLNIRKSTMDAGPPRQTKRAEGIPSYYEATKGQAETGGPRPIPKIVRPSVSMYGRSASAPDNAPPVPLSQRPGLDARRPSAPANPQRKMTDRGGLI